MIGNGHAGFGRGALEKGRKAPRQRRTSAAITDLTTHWPDRYKGVPGAPAVIEAHVREWCEQILVEVVPEIHEEVTPHTLRYTCIASLVAAGADQEYVAAQVGHEDVTTTSRIYRYVLQRRQRGEIGRRRQLAMRESAADVGRERYPPGRARER